MATYTVAAKRCKQGWELRIDGVGVTQSLTFATAHQVVRDYIETITHRETSGGDDVVISVEPAGRGG
jgi:hypothetical protein